MTSQPMTAFDAPRHLPQDRRPAPLSAVTRQPVVTLLLVLVTWLVLASTVAAGIAAQVITARIAALVGDARVAVYLDPQLTRAESQALGERIKALPFVAAVTLRSREEAIAAVDASDLPPAVKLKDRPNALPDVWLVALRIDAPVVSEDSLASETARAVAAIEALPGVSRARVDVAWLRRLGGWTERWLALSQWMGVAVVSVGSIILLSFAFLGARAIAGEEPADRRALGITGLVVWAVASMLAAASIWAGLEWLRELLAPVWKPMIPTPGLIDLANTLVPALSFLVALIIGAIAGYRRR